MYRQIICILLVGLVSIGMSNAFSCCTPNQWEGSSLSSTPSGMEAKNVYYDKVNLRVRIDTVTQGFNQTSYTYFANLNSTGTEWVVDTINGCYQTGPDYWNDQCFGDNYLMPYVSSSGNIATFYNPSNGIQVQVNKYTCLPIKISYTFSGIFTSYYGAQSYIQDPSVFQLPQECKK